MGEWKETTLKDVAAIDTGYAFKGDGYTDTGSLRVIRGMNVTIKDVRWGTDAKYWEHGTSGLEKYFLKESDIVIGMDGSRIGENRAMVKAHDLPSILAQRVARVRCIPGVSDQTYLWQVIASENFVAFIKSIFTGTSIPHISQGQLGSYELRLPPLPEQRAIASVLSSLDAKIDLLHRQNKTLEAMAEALFRQWFVEEAEEGWEEGALGDIMTVQGGTTPSTQNPAFWDGEYCWTTPRDLSGDDSLFLFDTARKITEAGLKQIGSGLLPVGTLLLSSRAPVGYTAFAAVPVAINQGYIAINANESYSNFFIYLWLKANMETVKGHANGSTFQEISKSAFKTIEITIPPKERVEEFDQVVEPLFDKVKSNQVQTQSLTKLRDTLLPKLMSGEVRVEQ